jgi:hypothetical protein
LGGYATSPYRIHVRPKAEVGKKAEFATAAGNGVVRKAYVDMLYRAFEELGERAFRDFNRLTPEPPTPIVDLDLRESSAWAIEPWRPIDDSK